MKAGRCYGKGPQDSTHCFEDWGKGQGQEAWGHNSGILSGVKIRALRPKQPSKMEVSGPVLPLTDDRGSLVVKVK